MLVKNSLSYMKYWLFAGIFCGIYSAVCATAPTLLNFSTEQGKKFWGVRTIEPVLSDMQPMKNYNFFIYTHAPDLEHYEEDDYIARLEGHSLDNDYSIFYINWIYVNEPFRSRGITGLLVQNLPFLVNAFAFDVLPIKKLVLMVLNTNTRAYDLYSRLGFVVATNQYPGLKATSYSDKKFYIMMEKDV